MDLTEALQTLRKQEKRGFSQSIDLVVTLKGIDPKKETYSTIITLPHAFKEKKVFGFFTKKMAGCEGITALDFPKYKEGKLAKKLVKNYDFFVAHGKVMPQVAAVFGKVLGPTGKMPSPQLGVLLSEDEAPLKALLGKINNAYKVRVKELAVKVSIGTEKMTDAQLTENITAFYQGLIGILPVKKDNVRRVLLKTTMGKPLEVRMA
jgi:large subunit ribosomal protein L1